MPPKKNSVAAHDEMLASLADRPYLHDSVAKQFAGMVPSLFPPLWPTIPANAAIP